MITLIWLVVLATSIWVLIDAKSIGVKKGQIKGIADMGPWGWFFVVLFLWIIGFPFYLAKREEYKRLNEMKHPIDHIPTPGVPAHARMICEVCKSEVDADAAFCDQCGNALQKNENYASSINRQMGACNPELSDNSSQAHNANAMGTFVSPSQNKIDDRKMILGAIVVAVLVVGVATFSHGQQHSRSNANSMTRNDNIQKCLNLSSEFTQEMGDASSDLKPLMLITRACKARLRKLNLNIGDLTDAASEEQSRLKGAMHNLRDAIKNVSNISANANTKIPKYANSLRMALSASRTFASIQSIINDWGWKGQAITACESSAAEQNDINKQSCGYIFNAIAGDKFAQSLCLTSFNCNSNATAIVDFNFSLDYIKRAELFGHPENSKKGILSAIISTCNVIPSIINNAETNLGPSAIPAMQNLYVFRSLCP